MTGRLRVLLANFGTGYEAALLRLARTCSEAGFEVVCTAVSDPKAIVLSAIQESVDHIGITTLPGATVGDFQRLFDALHDQGVTDIRVTAGGVFPQEDIPKILAMGLFQFYPGGSLYNIVDQWKAVEADEGSDPS